MKNNIKKIFSEKFELIVFIVMYFLYFLLTVNYHLMADDIVHYNLIAESSVIATYQYSLFIQPRIVTYFLTEVFVAYYKLWYILSPLPLVLVLFDFYHCVKKSADLKLLLIIMLSPLLMSISTFNTTFQWISGWTNYLVAFALMWFAIKPLFHMIKGTSSAFFKRKINFILYFIIGFSACWSEQFAAVIIGFCLFTIIYVNCSKMKLNKVSVAYILLLLASSCVFLYLTFHSTRSVSKHEYLYFPDFDMLSVLDKFFIMMNLTHNNIIFNSSLLIFPLLLLIAYVIYKKHPDSSPLVKFYGFIPLVIHVVLTLPFQLMTNYGMDATVFGTSFIRFIGETDNLSSHYLPVTQIIVPFFAAAEIFLMVFSVFLIFDDVREKLINFILLTGGLCAAYILMFSVTLYASGSRLYLLTELILLFVFAGVNSRAFQLCSSKAAKSIYCCCMLTMAMANWIILFIASNIKHIPFY